MAQWNRRNFMKGSLATATAGHLLPVAGSALAQATPASGGQRVVDTHVYLSRWPGRRILDDQPEELVSGLRKQGVSQAWTGSFDAILHNDVGAVNERLAADCKQYGQGLLLPFGAINPMLPDWEEDLRRCHETYRMPGIRVHPNYHSYTLEHPSFLRLLKISVERNLIVQIAAWMEDERVQNPLLLRSMVDLKPLAVALESAPRARVMVLNGFISLRSALVPWGQLKKFESLAFDIAMLEQMMGLKVLVDTIGVERVVFGSYSPMFYYESSFLKLREGNLSASQSEAVLSGNAGRLLGKA